MILENMVSALQELKGRGGLHNWIEDPKGIDGIGLMTEDLIENLITLVEFVEELPSDLEQCKEKIRSVSYDSDLVDKAINQGLDRAIGHIEDFINTLENPEVTTFALLWNIAAANIRKGKEKNMAIREIIIRIPENKYDGIIRQMRLDRNFSECEITELGEHGRLGDLDALEEEMSGGTNAGRMVNGYKVYPHINNTKDCLECVKHADTIIEAHHSTSVIE